MHTYAAHMHTQKYLIYIYLVFFHTAVQFQKFCHYVILPDNIYVGFLVNYICIIPRELIGLDLTIFIYQIC